MIPILIFVTILASLADVLLKVGASQAGDSLSDPFVLIQIPWIWMGAALGLTAMALWIYVLSRHHISHAYPIFVGLTFINITLASVIFLDESIGSMRLSGALLVLTGITVVHFRSRNDAATSPAATEEKAE